MKLLVLALLASVSLVPAQTPIGGSIYDGAGGPLLAGQVYHATSHVTVPSGQTLTVQPGAIVKLGGLAFTVNGTLAANGTAGNPVIFTSIHDDAAGGDTNGNGNATSPAPNQWYGITFNGAADASTLTHTTVRYTGVGAWAAVVLNSADITTTDCTFSDGQQGGMNLTNTSKPLVARCSFARCLTQPAVFGVRLDAVPGFTDNTASNNAAGNYLRVDTPSVTSPLAINANNCLGGVLVTTAHASVGPGASLTLGPGVILKTLNLAWTIDGTLTTNGTAANPVIFTSIHDDAAGGDTNGNGNATTPVPNQWYGITFNGAADASTLTQTIVRYTGVGAWAAAVLNSADITATDCTFSDGQQGGMNLTNSSKPLVTRCNFARCVIQPAVFGVRLDAVPGFTDNTASNNAAGNYLRVDTPTVTSPLAINANNCIGGVLVTTTHASVAPGVGLTVGPGVIFKTSNLAWTIDGTLTTNGTAANPVVFTSIHDDAAGGDTNGNGNATTPAPNQWYGITFNGAADASTLTHTIVRCTGVGAWAAAVLNSADITATDCTFSDGHHGGMNLTNSSKPVVTRCSFARCVTVPAVFGARLDAVPGFLDCTASDNAGGNYLRIDTPTLAGQAVIGSRNCLGAALVYTAHMSVPIGTTLVLHSGVILKASGAHSITVAGALHVEGPVIFTAFADDAYGGDTNGNGNVTSPAPGQWYGISIAASATASTIRSALVRYSGAGAWKGISCASPNVGLRACRVERGSSGGFLLSAAAGAQDLTAFVVSGHGIALADGTFDLKRCTSAFNTGAGITKTGTWTGTVRSSNSFGNGTDFAGFVAGEVHYSNGGGILGGTGNTNVDPQFVNASVGDLRLLPTSPSIDVGDPLDVAFGLDAIGFPRFLDGNLDGVQRVDQGANEYDNLILVVTGTPSPGSTITLTTLGNPIMTPVVLFAGAGPTRELPLLNFGSIFVDLLAPYVALGWVGVGGSVPLPIPTSLLTPLPFNFQLVALNGTLAAGNTSNPAIFTIQ